MRSRGIVVMAILAAALVSGGWLLQRGTNGTIGEVDRVRLFDEVMNHVARFYVDTLSRPELYERAVDGMLEELNDPHSVFLTADRLRRLTESTTGRYGGLGIQIDPREGYIVVVAPLPDTPAQRAGIQTGDRIVEIEGRTTRGWTSEEALGALRGPPGSRVTLVIERAGVDARIPMTLTRRDIQIVSVRNATVLRDGVGYLELNPFSETAAEDVRGAVETLRGQGMRQLILDLRGNPGGLLDQGVAVSELFLEPGQPIVTMRGRTPDANREFESRSRQSWPQMPMVVLVDSGSASAAEIVAGALQDHDRALVVGATTFGKGSAQSLFQMPGGGALKLTTALWYTPVGRSINRPLNAASRRDESAASEADDTTESRPREEFRTDGGRIVYGGGGITPDVLAHAAVAPEAQVAFTRALGRQIPQWLDVITGYALSLRESSAVRSRQFEVTEPMREELWRRMRQRGIEVDRHLYDEAAPFVRERLGVEIARYVFGPEAEFRRIASRDPVINLALELAAGAADQSDLFARADARADLRTPEPAGR